tara:strand:+ start:258 stop:482 length:225 start_codon:yes stop_codon:yes gene_type:complete
MGDLPHRNGNNISLPHPRLFHFVAWGHVDRKIGATAMCGFIGGVLLALTQEAPASDLPEPLIDNDLRPVRAEEW